MTRKALGAFDGGGRNEQRTLALAGVAFIIGVLVAGFLFGHIYDTWFERVRLSDGPSGEPAGQAAGRDCATSGAAESKATDATEADDGQEPASQTAPQGTLLEAVAMQALIPLPATPPAPRSDLLSVAGSASADRPVPEQTPADDIPEAVDDGRPGRAR